MCANSRGRGRWRLRVIDPEFPAGGGERSVKDRAWEPLPTSAALEKQAVEFEGLGWVKSSARRCTARSRQSGGTFAQGLPHPAPARRSDAADIY